MILDLTAQQFAFEIGNWKHSQNKTIKIYIYILKFTENSRESFYFVTNNYLLQNKNTKTVQMHNRSDDNGDVCRLSEV